MPVEIPPLQLRGSEERKQQKPSRRIPSFATSSCPPLVHTPHETHALHSRAAALCPTGFSHPPPWIQAWEGGREDDRSDSPSLPPSLSLARALERGRDTRERDT